MSTWQVETEDGETVFIDSTHALWQGDNVVLFYNLNTDTLDRTKVAIISGVRVVGKVET